MSSVHAGDYKRARFGPLGKCIYCGSDGAGKGLKSEHIFPYFLGGNIELLEASCAECEKIASYLDGHCANKIFRSFRAQKGLQTRRPKNRPTHFDIEYETAQGWVTRSLPVDAAPYMLPLPEFKMPSILESRTPSEGIEVAAFSLLTTSDTKERAEKFREPGDIGWRIPIPAFDPTVFARFVAKIALAGTVAMLKYDPAKSPLGGVVRGLEKRIGHYVGAEPPTTQGVTYTHTRPIIDGRDTNQMGFQTWANSVTGHQLLGAEIRFLLAHGGGAIRYVAVVGPAMPAAHIQAPIR